MHNDVEIIEGGAFGVVLLLKLSFSRQVLGRLRNGHSTSVVTSGSYLFLLILISISLEPISISIRLEKPEVIA